MGKGKQLAQQAQAELVQGLGGPMGTEDLEAGFVNTLNIPGYCSSSLHLLRQAQKGPTLTAADLGESSSSWDSKSKGEGCIMITYNRKPQGRKLLNG